jgi:ribonuclease HI
MAEVFTFGKYKNISIDNVFKKDKNYLIWLCKQTWFKNNHNILYDSSMNVIDSYSPIIDNDKFVVYTDGACPNNGNIKARASIGIHFSEKNLVKIEDISERLDVLKPSNNIAELSAICKTFELLKENNIKVPIEIYTDSKYCLSTIIDWYEKWKKENILHTKKNIPLVEKTYKLYKSFDDLKIYHVKGHSKKMDDHSCGNRIADQLARDAFK